ncbi:MAG: hypothetical protein ABSF81_17365 [Bacteroidales bacterium]|jgi:hypothetical protein
MSLEVRSDHFFMHLVESATFNKGKTKLDSGIYGFKSSKTIPKSTKNCKTISLGRNDCP